MDHRGKNRNCGVDLDSQENGDWPFVYTEGAGSSSLSPPNTAGKPLSEEGGFHFLGVGKTGSVLYMFYSEREM